MGRRAKTIGAFDMGISISLIDLVSGPLTNVQRKLTGFLGGVSNMAKVTEEDMRQLELTFTRASASIVAGTKAMALGFSMLASSFAPALMAANFRMGIAQITTLLDDSESDIQKWYREVMKLSSDFAQDANTTAKGMYTTVSAGFFTFREASTIMQAASRLAVAGLTDIFTASDGFTSVLNTWKMDVSQVNEVSDIFFATMRRGKTTIQELAREIGRLGPIAAQAGVSFAETMAMVATMTLTGQSTAEAYTSVRQMLQSIVRPTSMAQKMSAQLWGDEKFWSVQTLEKLGIVGFLDEVRKATSGRVGELTAQIEAMGNAEYEAAKAAGANTEELSRLVEGVQGLTAILALANNMNDQFKSILYDTTHALGNTDRALKKITDTAQFHFNRMLTRTKNVLIEIGDVALTFYGPLIKVMDTVLGVVLKLIGNLRVLIGAVMLVVGAIGSALLAWGAYTTYTAAASVATNALAIVIAKLNTELTVAEARSLITGRNIRRAFASGFWPVVMLTVALDLVRRGLQSNQEIIERFNATWRKWETIIRAIREGLSNVYKDKETGEEFASLTQRTVESLDELGTGILDFTGRLIAIAYRIQKFWTGFKAGFNAVLDVAAIGFRYLTGLAIRLVNWLARLVEKFTGLSMKIQLRREQIDAWELWGKIIGGIVTVLGGLLLVGKTAQSLITIVNVLKLIGVQWWKAVLFPLRLTLGLLRLLLSPLRMLLSLGKSLIGFAIRFGPAIGQALLAFTKAHPVLAIISVVAMAIILVWKNWDKVKRWAENAINAFRSKLEQVKTWAQNIVDSLTNKLENVRTWAANIVDAVKSKFSEIATAVKDSIQAISDWAKNLIGSVGNFFNNIWSNAKRGLQNALLWFGDRIVDFLDAMPNWLTNLFGISQEEIDAMRTRIDEIRQQINGISSIEIPEVTVVHRTQNYTPIPYPDNAYLVGPLGEEPEQKEITPLEFYRPEYLALLARTGPAPVTTPAYASATSYADQQMMLASKLDELLRVLEARPFEATVLVDIDGREVYRTVQRYERDERNRSYRRP